MANYFVSSASGAGGAGNGSSWANAFLTLAAANAFPIAAGDTLLVGDDHAEWTSGSVTVSLPSFGVSTTPNNIIVVDHTKPSPSIPADLKIGAYGAGSLSASGNINFNFSGYVYGLYVRNGVDAVGVGVATSAISIQCQSSRTFYFDSCTFLNSSTGTSLLIMSPGGSEWLDFKNCTFINLTANVAFLLSGCWVKLTNCTFTFPGASATNYFFQTGTFSQATFEGCDFSQFGGTYLVNHTSNGGIFHTFKDCKLPAGTPFTLANALRPNSNSVWVVNCDSGNTNYRNELYDYGGELHTSTSVVRTGGASQGTAYSWKVTTNANVRWYAPFKLMALSIWNSTTGAAKNVTVEGIADPRDFSALPNNDDIWIDVEALENASLPQGTYHVGTKTTPLGTNSALTASTAAWDCSVSRANSTAYSVGDIRKVASNAGRLFVCTTAGTSAGSEPGGYATAVDGDTITDGGATFKAMRRFKQTITTGSIGMAGLITVYPKVAKASLNGIYIDPMITLS
jgi:hypothetical protein